MSGARVHEATFARHHLSTCKIDLTAPDTATVRTSWVAWTDVGPDHAGYYLDTFRQVGEEWLIAHRRVREDWRSPASLFGNPIAQTHG
jgi:3-phenylpropionate/cinnamic acid dioxygenase small subunit